MFRAWAVEHRFRHLSLALGLVVFGAFLLGFGYKSWETDHIDPGVKEVLGHGLVLAGDGGFLSWIAMPEPHLHVVRDEGVHERFALDDDEASPRAAAAPAFVTASHRFVPGGWIDLRDGSSHPAPWNASFVPAGAWGSHVYGLDEAGAIHRHDADDPGSALRLPPPSAAAQCAGEPSLVAFQDGVAFTGCGGEGTLWVWTGGSGWRWTQLPGRPSSGPDGALWAASSSSLALVTADNRIVVVDVGTLASAMTEVLPGTGSDWLDVAFDGDRWAVSGVRSGSSFLVYDEVIVWGNADGSVEGHAQMADHHLFSGPPAEVAVLDGDVVYTANGQVRVMGAPSLEPMTWAMLIGGGLMVAVGLGWYPAQRALLARTADAGNRLCLHCGARRRQAIAFCPECGWRTGEEKSAAAPRVDPWDKER